MRRRHAAALVLAVGLVMAGCGDDNGIEGLQGGSAHGPGYSFRPGDGWRRVENGSEADRKVAARVQQSVKGLDLKGFGPLGVFGGPRRKGAPIVTVLIEPVTPDTTTRDVAFAARKQLEQRLGTAVPDPVPARIAGQDPHALSFTMNGLASRGMIARRGNFVYDITVQSRSPITAEKTARRVAATWRFKRLSAAEREQLDRTARAHGTGYSASLPPGWRATGRKGLAGTPAAGNLDALWRGRVTRKGTTNVAIERDPAPGVDLDRIVPFVIRNSRRGVRARVPGARISVSEPRVAKVGGEPARRVDTVLVTKQGPGRQRLLITVHRRQLYVIGLTTRDPSRDLPAFSRSMRSWRWTH